MNGQPCIRGMRLTVKRVLQAVSLYPDTADLFRNYPELEPGYDCVHVGEIGLSRAEDAEILAWARQHYIKCS
jgi:hypothetical protein